LPGSHLLHLLQVLEHHGISKEEALKKIPQVKQYVSHVLERILIYPNLQLPTPKKLGPNPKPDRLLQEATIILEVQREEP
jgi:hypothetical protein